MIDSNPTPDPDCTRKNRDCAALAEGNSLPGDNCGTDEPASLRAIKWEDVTGFLGAHLVARGRPAVLRKIPSPGIKFTRGVPRPLQHIGCMWLEEGDEARRCGDPPAWIMGTDPSLARLYCEGHGQLLNLRRCRESLERRRRKARPRDDTLGAGAYVGGQCP